MENNELETFLIFIRSKSRVHQEKFQEEVSVFIKETEKIYLNETDLFISKYKVNPELEKILRPFYTKVSEYLKWLRWIYWNVANLGPVLFKERQAAAQRLALSSLAYVSGRFIDDGFDDHENFKGLQRTLVGFLRDSSPGSPLHEGCVQSVYTGFHLFHHIVMRFRYLQLNDIASELSRLFDIASVGLLSECHTGAKVTAETYIQIVRRKAVAYNMILYKPFLQEAGPDLRDSLLTFLGEMDELAQILNDLGDQEEDKLKNKMNISSHIENSFIIVNEEIESRVQKLMALLASLPGYLQNALSAMLVNLKLETYFNIPEPVRLFTIPSKTGSKIKPGTPYPLATNKAIANALAYLCKSQGINGEFTTYWSENTDMTSANKISSPFITGMVLLALQDINEKRINKLKDKGVAYLERSRKTDGFFSFLETGIDDDLDDTCLLNYIIQQQGKPEYYAQLAERISHLASETGFYYTWVRADRETSNDIDPCVNLNVLRFLYHNGIDCSPLIKAIRTVFESNKIFERTIYYQPVWTFLYLFSTLPINLKLELATVEQVNDILTCPTASDPIDLAMCLYCLASAGKESLDMQPLVIQLLELQEASGNWPNCPAFRAFNYWGSPDLTTAICVQALQKYSECNDC